MKRIQNPVFIVSLCLLVVCLWLGFSLAGHRPLWNDEIFTECMLESAPLKRLFPVNEMEGNVTPLFYFIQKGITASLGYSVPAPWKERDWGYSDVYSQLVLRINPVFFMSLTIVSIFYFFSRFYSYGWGIYALIITLTSYMLWAYWTEARPYALWAFLSTLQSLLFLYIVDQKKKFGKAWSALAFIHILLPLTIMLGAIQVLAVSFLLWMVGYKNFRAYILLTLIPMALAVFYYFHSPMYGIWFSDGPLALISANFPKDRLFVLFVFAILWLGCLVKQKKGNGELPWNCSALKKGGAYFFLTALMLLGAGFLLLIYKIKSNTIQDGFPISNRYFMFLMPVGIVATVIFTKSIWEALAKQRWLQIGFLASFGILFILRTYNTFQLVRSFYHF